jgi:predicted nucleic acid-binding protein
MAELKQKRLLSLDTNLVLDLAREKDFAHEFRETFQGKGYGLMLPPAVAYELHVIYARSDTGEEREWASAALVNLKRWGIRPFDLDSTSEAIAEQFARRLLHLGLIPLDELGDGLILAQSSLGQIPLLATSDNHLLDVDENTLLLLFTEADLFPVRPLHPKRLLRALR